MRAAELRNGFFQFGRRGHLGLAEALRGEAPIGEKANGEADAANGEAFDLQGPSRLTQDELGGAPPDIDHQPCFAAGLQARHAAVDETSFFAPRNDLDREAERCFGALQESIPVLGFAQGLSRHRANALRRKTLQLGTESSQAGQRPCRGCFGQHAVCIKPGA